MLALGPAMQFQNPLGGSVMPPFLQLLEVGGAATPKYQSIPFISDTNQPVLRFDDAQDPKPQNPALLSAQSLKSSRGCLRGGP